MSVTARTQQELDQALADGAKLVYIDSPEGVWLRISNSGTTSEVVARGSSQVVARGGSHVEGWGSSHVEARALSHVVARDSSFVVA
ncbi:MAG: hypothetical protein RBS21_05550, partial [Corynebacterium sp.]|nr:hypothetical protein [Corynebacterium sp.]